jgi:hypothetical protein
MDKVDVTQDILPQSHSVVGTLCEGADAATFY